MTRKSLSKALLNAISDQVPSPPTYPVSPDDVKQIELAQHRVNLAVLKLGQISADRLNWVTQEQAQYQEAIQASKLLQEAIETAGKASGAQQGYRYDAATKSFVVG